MDLESIIQIWNPQYCNIGTENISKYMNIAKRSFLQTKNIECPKFWSVHLTFFSQNWQIPGAISRSVAVAEL